MKTEKPRLKFMDVVKAFILVGVALYDLGRDAYFVSRLYQFASYCTTVQNSATHVVRYVADSRYLRWDFAIYPCSLEQQRAQQCVSMNVSEWSPGQHPSAWFAYSGLDFEACTAWVGNVTAALQDRYENAAQEVSLPPWSSLGAGGCAGARYVGYRSCPINLSNPTANNGFGIDYEESQGACNGRVSVTIMAIVASLTIVLSLWPLAAKIYIACGNLRCRARKTAVHKTENTRRHVIYAALMPCCATHELSGDTSERVQTLLLAQLTVILNNAPQMLIMSAAINIVEKSLCTSNARFIPTEGLTVIFLFFISIPLAAWPPLLLFVFDGSCKRWLVVRKQRAGPCSTCCCRRQSDKQVFDWWVCWPPLLIFHAVAGTGIFLAALAVYIFAGTTEDHKSLAIPAAAAMNSWVGTGKHCGPDRCVDLPLKRWLLAG